MARPKERPKALALPDSLVQMLAAEDKRKNFPAGTMQSLLMQEVGGKLDQFLSDPSKYHYEPNAQGKRVANHTGKVSTAFGPFGILESTARKPGYGVTPLKDKSLGEQLRFAADYLDARSRVGGSLHAGLAGYGEGKKYADQVIARRTPGADGPPVAKKGDGQGGDGVVVSPVMDAAVQAQDLPPQLQAQAQPQPEPQLQAQAQPEVIPAHFPDDYMNTQVAQAAPGPVVDGTGSGGGLGGYSTEAQAPMGADPWLTFNQALLAKRQVDAQAMAYGQQGNAYGMPMPSLKVPDFASMAQYMPTGKPSFGLKRGRG
jgi:hypothetical protein